MSSDGRKIGPYFLRVTLVFALYLASGRFGLAAPFTSGNVSPFWPAAGIALAGVLLWGYQVWPGIALGAFLVNYFTPIPVLAAAGIAAGNTLAALVAGFLLRKARFDPKLECLRDVLALIAFGALASPLVAAVAGNTTLSLTHVKAWSGFHTALAVWWFGDAMGVLIGAPVALGSARLGRGEERVFRPELGFLLVGSAFTALAIFSQSFRLDAGNDVLAFAVFPFVIWAAVRFSLAGASTVCLVITLIAVWGTAHGSGPFVKRDPLHNAVLLQLFLSALSVIGLLLAAIIGERTRAEGALRTLSGHLLRLQDAERRRLARELHDSSGQHLVALQMSLAALQQRIGQNDRASAELIEESQQTLDRVVKEIRTLSYLLHPPLLDEVGLCSALRWYVDGLVARSQLQIELDLPRELARLSQEVETAIFRIVQECLTNIYRHSGSPVATVSLSVTHGQLILRVVDRGKGIGSRLQGDPLGDPSILGVGIRGIGERVHELGGRLRIKNLTPGALVEVILPLRVEDQALVKQAQGNVQGQPQNA
jgi:signal transduction histidine kinase